MRWHKAVIWAFARLEIRKSKVFKAKCPYTEFKVGLGGISK